MGEFWPEDIDVTMCDVIYYGFGNILNDTYEVKLQYKTFTKELRYAYD